MTKKPGPSRKSPLSDFVARLQNDESYMAWVLDTYQKQERMSPEQLQKKLETTSKMFTRLALCKRPDVQSSDFAKQVRQLASYTEIDTLQLANILRQVSVLDAFSQLSTVTDSQEKTGEQLRKRSIRGAFAAARDQEEQKEPEPDNGIEDQDN